MCAWLRPWWVLRQSGFKASHAGENVLVSVLPFLQMAASRARVLVTYKCKTMRILKQITSRRCQSAAGDFQMTSSKLSNIKQQVFHTCSNGPTCFVKIKKEKESRFEVFLPLIHSCMQNTLRTYGKLAAVSVHLIKTPYVANKSKWPL